MDPRHADITQQFHLLPQHMRRHAGLLGHGHIGRSGGHDYDITNGIFNRLLLQHDHSGIALIPQTVQFRDPLNIIIH